MNKLCFQRIIKIHEVKGSHVQSSFTSGIQQITKATIGKEPKQIHQNNQISAVSHVGIKKLAYGSKFSTATKPGKAKTEEKRERVTLRA